MKRVNFTPTINQLNAGQDTTMKEKPDIDVVPKSYEEQLHDKLQSQYEDNKANVQKHGDQDQDIDDETLLGHIIEALKTVYDPEIPVNIYDLGLIYRINVEDGDVEIDMTLTAPGCPVAHTFPGMVERTVELVPGVGYAQVELVWEPPWHQELISEAARLELGLL